MSTEIGQVMERIGRAAVDAASVLALASTEQKNAALAAAAKSVRETTADILSANAKDTESARERDLSSAMLDRLKLDEKRVEGIARAIEEVRELPDPIGTVAAEWQ